MKAVILKNDLSGSADNWIKACQNQNLNFSVVDLTGDDWLKVIKKESPGLLLACPPGLNDQIKRMYDEKIEVLAGGGYKLYPQLHEIKLHENKRFLAYWLEINDIPHPSTHVFYSKDEGITYLENAIYPLVAKINIGASGSGVKILRDKNQAVEYITNAFSRGVTSSSGPNFKKGHKMKRGFYALTHPFHIINRFKAYKSVNDNIQRHFVIIQDYVKHEFEWRVVVIGKSYFAHKKVRIKEKASGSLVKKYDPPPESLLNFVRSLVETHHLRSEAFDIFELADDHYLVNEIQCIFGQSDPYQMLINNKPGRYLFENGWKFEEGDFNVNESFDLRLKDALSYYNLIK
jgi:hypothetical protein